MATYKYTLETSTGFVERTVENVTKFRIDGDGDGLFFAGDDLIRFVRRPAELWKAEDAQEGASK